MAIEKQPFLQKLQQEAQLQAKLNASRVIPAQFDGITSIIGRYPWQVLLCLSGITALLIELLKFI